jgi:hypothetical protein
MTSSDPPTVAVDAGDDPATTIAFTRGELDAAEPERHRSGAWRWLIGVGLGVLALTMSLWAAPASLLVLVAIPLAWTWTGAGILVGFGASVTLMAAGQWVAQQGAGDDAFAWFVVFVFNTALAVGCLVVGLTATIIRLVLARSGMTLDEAAVFRPNSSGGTRRRSGGAGRSSGRDRG